MKPVMAVLIAVCLLGVFTEESESGEKGTEDQCKKELEAEKTASGQLRRALEEVRAELFGKEQDPHDGIVETATRGPIKPAYDACPRAVQVAGFSIKCVPEGGCDAAERLAEATAAADQECARFCADCMPYRYDPPANCAVERCNKEAPCPEECCPFYNICRLEGDPPNHRFNCHCKPVSP
jgi:hypothetical protein